MQIPESAPTSSEFFQYSWIIIRRYISMLYHPTLHRNPHIIFTNYLGPFALILCAQSDIFTSHWSLFWVGRSDFLSLVGAKETTLLGIISKTRTIFWLSRPMPVSIRQELWSSPQWQYIYIRTVSLLSTLLIQFKLVYRAVWLEPDVQYTWFLPQTSQEGNKCKYH